MSLLDEVKANGLVRGISMDVYEIIFKHVAAQGISLSGGVIHRKYRAMHPGTKLSRNETQKRVNDLVNWGAVKETGKGHCPVTGKLVKMWSITGKMPVKTPDPRRVRKDVALNASDSPSELKTKINVALEETRQALSAVSERAVRRDNADELLSEVRERNQKAVKLDNVRDIVMNGRRWRLVLMKALAGLDKKFFLTRKKKEQATAIAFALNVLQNLDPGFSLLNSDTPTTEG